MAHSSYYCYTDYRPGLLGVKRGVILGVIRAVGLLGVNRCEGLLGVTRGLRDEDLLL